MSAEQGHASIKQYIVIGVILTIITAIEVAFIYIPGAEESAWLVPALIALSTLKFALVVMFYMHLKFDSKIFSIWFFGPMVLAVTVVIGLVLLLKVLPTYNP